MANSNVYAKYLDTTEHTKWNEFVYSSPSGSIYSTSDYLEALCSVTGDQYKILAVFKGKEIVGGIGLYEKVDKKRPYISSRHLLRYNGIVLKGYSSKHPYKQMSKNIEVMSCLEEELSKSCYSSINLYNRNSLLDFRIFQKKGWNIWIGYTYIVRIEDLQEFWDKIEQNQRRLIKRCEREGAIISVDDDFGSFYRFHENTSSRKGAPLYLSEGLFRKYYDKLKAKNLIRLYHVRIDDGSPIASQLVLLGKHPVTHTVAAGADPKFMKTGATPFLRFKVFEDLSKLGYVANDLTGGALDEVGRFKAQLGGNLELTLTLSSPVLHRKRILTKISKLLEYCKK